MEKIKTWLDAGDEATIHNLAKAIASAMPKNSPKSNELVHYVRGWNARGNQFTKNLEGK